MEIIKKELCEEARGFLDRVRSLLATNEFQVSIRDKNQEFLEKYKIKDSKIKRNAFSLE